MKFSLFICLLAFVCFVYSKDINAIVKFNSKLYAFDGYNSLDSPPDNFSPSAFEVVGGIQTNTYSLILPNTSAVVESSIIIDSNLYQFSGAYGAAYLSKYSLPFTSNTVLPVAQLELANQIQGIPAIFNTKDNIALALVSRYLTLISLATLSAQDSILAVAGSGKNPGCIVYNQKSQKVYYFQSDYCFAGYCQHIFEFKVNLNTYKLTSLSETFSPDYASTFNTGALTGCALDTDNNVIWCLNAKTERLFKFPVSNLNSYTSIKLPAGPYTASNVAFNFGNSRAYVTVKGTYSFTLHEINLNNGNVPRTEIYTGGSDVASMNIVNNGQTLLLGFKFKGIRQMASIDLDDLSNDLINLYA